ncbi:MAG: DUF882 domain-containing protein [Thioalkalispiraceae bacterium]|jgi:uncharacterized protein YcbK (DUF882 family)
MISRRQFLLGATASLSLLSSPLALARPALARERRLKFYNLHTGEHLSAIYWVEGKYIPEQLAAINKLLRDHRTGEIEVIDRRLLNQLFILQHKIENHGSFHIISGYRSPKTNARLRKTGSGVAKRSLHMQGRAVDVRLPGVELKHLRQAALKLHAGGVGYYPKSNFVHLDTGRARFW